MQFILFTIAGAGCGYLTAKRSYKNIFFWLGAAFSVPLLIHLFLSIGKFVSTGNFPWGYWGINETHGDLAYTASQAVIFLGTYLLFNATTIPRKIIVLALIAICIISPLIASSRTGVAFVLFGIFLIVAIHFFFYQKNIKLLKKINLIIGFILISIFLIGIGIKIDPVRWANTIPKIQMGFQGSPLDIYCNGIDSLEKDLIRSGYAITPETKIYLDSVIDGDGARIMAARAGLELISKNLMGIDQSRQAFQIALKKECLSSPKIFISHTHNAWIDTALAIGLPGSILFFLVLFCYAKRGWISLRYYNNEYGVALLSMSILWGFMALVNAAQRDQMLEMQGFNLAFLGSIVQLANTNFKKI